MDALCSRHFPRIVFREGARLLWNPVTRQAAVNRPEERVRLQMVDYLLLEAGISKNRISTEHALGRGGASDTDEEGRRRTDIVVFAEDLSQGAVADTLVECKSRSVAISDAAAVQIARYNQTVGARRLWLCNGLADHWFNLDEGGVHQSDTPPHPAVADLEEIRRTPGYWVERGFIADKSPEEVRTWLENVLIPFWEEDSEWKSGYLDLSRNQWDTRMSHYYRLIHVDDDTDIALGFVAPSPDQTWLIALMNKSQSNAGMIATCLEDLARGEKDNTFIHTINDKRTADLGDHIPLQPFRVNPMIIHNLPGFYGSWFRQILTL
jgi:hypothetical protein